MEALDELYKLIPPEVAERFKKINKNALSGERKRWTLPNTNEEFDPLNNFEERTDKLLDSPIMNHLADKIRENA